MIATSMDGIKPGFVLYLGLLLASLARAWLLYTGKEVVLVQRVRDG